MKPMFPTDQDCCGEKAPACDCDHLTQIRPSCGTADDDIVCCGEKGEQSSVWDRPGYALCGFVADFMETKAGSVPKIKTHLEAADLLGAVRVRLGVFRDAYKISPGLYAVGAPNDRSPVLVSANYKLSFDTLRKHLGGLNAWILVLDTRGINVWCAAGKGTFSTEEVVRQVKATRLETLVSHKELILPQLAATGVSGVLVKKGCGFKVVWGPVRAGDIPAFLQNGMTAEPAMRRVTFPLPERFILTPVELSQTPKPLLRIFIALFILSGIGPGVFSLSQAWTRSLTGMLAVLCGLLAGAVLTPVLLPWIPPKAFSVKGAIVGVAAWLCMLIGLWGRIGFAGAGALLCFTVVISSYTAMNFTGSTPFTSPSGVEKEMRKAIPLQIGGAVLGVIVWIGSAFTGAI